MLFNDQGSFQPDTVLAISQPAHALLAGQMVAAWAEPLDDALVLAAGQHDVAWLDWETAPSFDAATGRPHEFRAIGAARHAPMWERGVERALAAWGRRPALMISRHGSTIYRRFTDRHRSDTPDADERAAQDYLRRHQAKQDDWARALGLDATTVAFEAELIALVDTLSLVLCGTLPVPPSLSLGDRHFTLSAASGALRLDPWPFVPATLTFEVEARKLPPERFRSEAEMRVWLADPARVTMRASLAGARA